MRAAPRRPARGGTAVRDALERRFRDRLVGRPELRWLASFAGNRDQPVHRWFTYKEGFSRGLVERLLERFDLSPDATIVDPFCGVGTTPLVARLGGWNAVGIDLLPLAAFVARVKLRTRRELPMDLLRRAVERLPRTRRREPSSRFADMPLVRRAFEPETAREILLLRDGLAGVRVRPVREFLLLALLASLEELSHTRKDGLCVRVQPRSEVPAPRRAVGARARAMLVDLEAQELGDRRRAAPQGL